MSISAERSQYDGVAISYNDYESLPAARIEAELVTTGLGDCTGLRVIDLGGGSGMHARKALDFGASVVDVVDISPEMLKIGTDLEKTFGRQEKVNYHLADVTKSIDGLGLQKGSYDLVIANWLFDHATSIQDLEGMWQNISDYAKPGARFLGTRVANVYSESNSSGKYGLVFKDIKAIPDGVIYRVICATNPPFEFEATSMEVSYSGSTEMHEKYGFKDVSYIDIAETRLAKSDPAWWKLCLDDPWFVTVTATKAT